MVRLAENDNGRSPQVCLFLKRIGNTFSRRRKRRIKQNEEQGADLHDAEKMPVFCEDLMI
jgi:hypothetical protein